MSAHVATWREALASLVYFYLLTRAWLKRDSTPLRHLYPDAPGPDGWGRNGGLTRGCLVHQAGIRSDVWLIPVMSPRTRAGRSRRLQSGETRMPFAFRVEFSILMYQVQNVWCKETWLIHKKTIALVLELSIILSHHACFTPQGFGAREVNCLLFHVSEEFSGFLLCFRSFSLVLWFSPLVQRQCCILLVSLNCLKCVNVSCNTMCPLSCALSLLT